MKRPCLPRALGRTMLVLSLALAVALGALGTTPAGGGGAGVADRKSVV